jgi:nucleoside-diphosphate-sugar epimerase
LKILLTGGTGFLGTHLLAEFLQRNYQVLLTKRANTDISLLVQQFGKLEAWDTEATGFDDLFHRHSDIDVIVHAATNYGRDDSRPTETFWANEAFPIRLIELAIRHNVALFINMDTFFNSSKVLYDYLGAYTLSKRHFQEWGQHCANTGRIAFTNLKLFHLYGPGDGGKKFVPAMVARCMAGEEIDLTAGKQKRDFIHIDDAVAAVITVLESEAGRRGGYRHYDVGTGTAIRIRDFIETVKRLCSSNAKLNFGAVPNRKGEFQNACAEIEALRALGWAPQVGIEAGIRTVIEDIGRRDLLN